MINFFNKRFYIIFVFPLILGGISTLSFQPFNFFFINFFSLSSLFFLMVYVKKKSKSTYRKKPFLKNLFILGSSFGFGFFFFGFYWIANSLTFDNSFKFLIPFSLILIPLFLSLFFSVPILIVGNFIDNNISSILLVALIFSLSDFLRSIVLTGFPWNLWVYSLSWSLENLQILSEIGTFSLNLLIILFFFIPSVIFFKTKIKYFLITFFVILFFSNYFYGSIKINSSNDNIEDGINFKIVSGGLDLSEFRDKEEVALKMIRYSDPDKTKETIFIWPEGTFYGENFSDLKDLKPIFAKYFSNNHIIILGANTQKKANSTTGWKYFNSMVIVDNNLNIIAQYDKKKLVPFGEFLPFETFLNKIGIKKITPGYSSFAKGKSDSVMKFKFNNKDISFLALICYEIIFPNLIEKNKNRFNFVANISEDAWFGDTIGPHQHFSKAIFRSIESEVYTIRSANKGISAFLSPNGKILKSLSLNEAGNIEMQLPILKTNREGYKKSLIFLLLLITFIFTFFLLKKFRL